MKKNRIYLKPIARIFDVETEEVIAESSGIMTLSDETETENSRYSNNYRSNLWGDE